MTLQFPCLFIVFVSRKWCRLAWFAFIFRYFVVDNDSIFSLRFLFFKFLHFRIGDKDRAKCFYCNGGLQNWDPEDEPFTEHAKWFPGLV